MSRILVDLTEFKDWNGHLTGIQRVVYGIASNLQTRDNVIFCEYDHKTKRLVHQDISVYDTSVNESSDSGSNRSHLKQELIKLYFKMPYRVRNRVTANQKRKLLILAKNAYKLNVLSKNAVKNVLIKKQIETPTRAVNLNSDDTVLLIGRLWDHADFMQYLLSEKERINIKLAVVIYDLIPIYQQHTFGKGLTEPFTRYLFNTLTSADIVLPISQSSSNDLKVFASETGFLKLPEVHVIRLGDNLGSTNKQLKPDWLIKGEGGFGICVGTIEARKNHTLIYYAYKLAAQEKNNLPKLYIIGKPGWLTSDILYAIEQDDDVNQLIKVIKTTSDEELSWLYSNALFTVFPSQYEGWGLPIAESLLYGTPCIASNTSSMIEIAPNLVDHISPYDTRDLLDKIVYYSDHSNSADKRREIKDKYTPYLWSETAIKLYKKLSLLNSDK